MSHRTSVHDLKGLILSFHSLIAIETVEEERVRELLNEIAADLRLPFFEWSITSGFARVHGSTVPLTEDPLAALKHIAEIENTDAIYLLKDLGPHLGNPNVARLLRETVQKLTSTRSALVLTGEPVELPKDMERLAVRFALELPDDDCELHWLLMDVIKVLEKNPEADCSRLGVISYASTPCENCRFDAARLLLDQHVAPDWLVDECRYDSGEEGRALVDRSTGSTEAS